MKYTTDIRIMKIKTERTIIEDFSSDSPLGVKVVTPFVIIFSLFTRQPSKLVLGSSSLTRSIGVPSDPQLKVAILPVIIGDQKRYFSPYGQAKIDMTFSLSVTIMTFALTGGHSAVSVTFSSFGGHSACINALGFHAGSVEYRVDITTVLSNGWNFKESESYEMILAGVMILAN